MADGIKISQMQEKTTLEGTEFFPIVDGSSNKKVKTDKLATKDDIPSIDGLLSKTEAQDLYQSKGDYALKSEIPDVEGFITETDADSKYQAKGDYALKSEIPTDYLTEDEAGSLYQTKLVSGQNIKTINGQSILGGGDITITEGGDVIDSGIPDAPNDNKLYGRKNADWSEIVMPEVPDVSEFITEAEADEKYQTKGDYALKSEIPNVDEFITETDADGKYATISSLDNKLDKTTYDSDKETFATKTDIDDMLTKTEAEQNYQEKGDYLTEIPSDVVRLTAAKDIILPINGSITMIQNESAGSGGVVICQRDYGEGNVTEVSNARNKLTLNATERPQIDVAGGQEKMAYVSDVDEVRANFDTINLVQKNTTNYELQVGDRIAGSVDISKVGMYYPGVKVDTQKLFALTKGSTEDEIKAALQLETSSGSYTLPTSEILDSCLGKGYQLLSNWMPVSVAWNGAGYVLYIIGQNYLNKPNGLYTVTIKITDGVYSVFQAAKFVEFASKDYVDEVAGDKTNVLILSLENDLANGEKDQPVTAEVSEALVDAVDTGKACVIKTANSDILANLQKTGDNVTIIMEQVSRISTYFLAVNTAITVNTTSNIISNYSTGAINLADSGTLATKEEVKNKQDKLVSGTNIKTVNGNSLLGEGNVTIEIPDTSDMLTKTDAADTYQVKGEYANNSDLVYIADTVIPQMNTNTANALDKKVDWDEEKKVISLPADGSISALRNAETLEGGVLLAQRTYDEGTTYVTEVGTTKNSLTLNSTSRPKVDLQGGTSEELAYVDDLRTLPIEINIPIRSLKDKVYDQSTILGWFGVEEISDLKSLIASGGIQYLRYGISLTGNPHYYKMPVEYVAFESANQIKLVCIGLDTSNDSPVRYTIILNLDGTIASSNSNVSMVLDPISGEEVDLSSYYTKEEVDSKLKSYATVTQVQEKQDQLVSGVNIKTVNGASLLGEGDIVIETPDGGIPDAAQDGKIYGRQNGSWVEIPSLSTIDGGTFDSPTTTLKETSIPTKVTDLDDSDDYATKEYVDQKVGTKISGVGVNSIQVVTELPEVQEDGVLYIVVAASA